MAATYALTPPSSALSPTFCCGSSISSVNCPIKLATEHLFLPRNIWTRTLLLSVPIITNSQRNSLLFPLIALARLTNVDYQSTILLRCRLLHSLISILPHHAFKNV